MTYADIFHVLVEKVDTKPEESSNAQKERKNFNIDDMLILQSCFDGKLISS